MFRAAGAAARFSTAATSNRDNRLEGRGGNDTLTGRAGNDLLKGGAGNDTFVFDPSPGDLGTDSIVEANAADSDTLDFSAFSSALIFDLAGASSQTVLSGTLVVALSSDNAIENVIGSATGSMAKRSVKT